MDFWISDWISGFHSGFLDFSLDFWISVWISADGVRDFFRDGPLDKIRLQKKSRSEYKNEDKINPRSQTS